MYSLSSGLPLVTNFLLSGLLYFLTSLMRTMIQGHEPCSGSNQSCDQWVTIYSDHIYSYRSKLEWPKKWFNPLEIPVSELMISPVRWILTMTDYQGISCHQYLLLRSTYTLLLIPGQSRASIILGSGKSHMGSIKSCFASGLNICPFFVENP